MTPTRKGDIVEQRCILDFMKAGFVVSVPNTSDSRYDLLVDGGKILRIQCKKANYKNDYFTFEVASRSYSRKTSRRSARKSYHGFIDYFYTYCFETDKAYLIPVSETGRTEMIMRLVPPLRNIKYNHAADYEFEKVVKTLLN